jgi:DNA helicase-2/ATP-dependent DNA helicase PcrA
MAFSLDVFNERQREAVMHTEGPSMIVAGPGSGKTKVLTTRMAYLIKEKKVDPDRILALTFTNKAADEMKKRIEDMVGPDAKSLWLGTFHSCFARILRLEASIIGYPKHFSIYDTADSKSLLKTLIKEMNLDDKIYTTSVVLSRISAAKNRLITAQEYVHNFFYQQEDTKAFKPRMGEIYVKYATRCTQATAMDFDDVLLYTHLLLSQHAPILSKYQEQFQYILIDEFQDTNLAQYTVVRNLSRLYQNICVVGDDAQSIYAFRGADIRNILNFENDYPQLTITRLEQNYRSTKHIVAVANAVIANNQSQLKKKVWTDNEEGETVTVMRAATDAEEGRLVAVSISEIKAQQQLSNSNFAILYRTNSQSRAIEEALRKLSLPYRMLGGMSFYQRKEVKDLLSYLRFITNHNDEEALKRIINEPKRGIGPTHVEKMVIAAQERGMSLWDVMCRAREFFAGRVTDALEEFTNMVRSIALQLPQKDAYEIAIQVAQQSGVLKILYEDKTIEGVARYENVQELLSAIKAFTAHPEQSDTSLVAFLQDISLATYSETLSEETENKVLLMTIHAAKGLEFKYVYIVGLEEDLFPSSMVMGIPEALEEERRLFYVALTRAQKKVFLSYTLSRYRFGRLKQSDISRFILEIDPTYLQPVKHINTYAEVRDFSDAKRLIPSFQRTPQQLRKLPTYLSAPASSFTAGDALQLEPGMQVQHPMFGIGVVLSVEEFGSQQKARINFENAGEKALLLKFAKLKTVE